MGSGFYDEVKNDAIIKIIMIIIIIIIIVFFILIFKKTPQIQMREIEKKREREYVCMRVKKKGIYISRTFIYRDFCSTVKLASFKGRGKTCSI